MSDTQWVQHFSGQGEKFEVVSETDPFWQIRWKLGGGVAMLPKSEYTLCPPPEQWEVVQGSEWVIDSDGQYAKLRWGHWESGFIEAPAHVRFTTINDALVLERKVGG